MGLFFLLQLIDITLVGLLYPYTYQFIHLLIDYYQSKPWTPIYRWIVTPQVLALFNKPNRICLATIWMSLMVTAFVCALSSFRLLINSDLLQPSSYQNSLFQSCQVIQCGIFSLVVLYSCFFELILIFF